MNRAQANQLWCELFTRKRLGWLPVLTGSMAPMVRPGDQVLVTFISAEQIGFGDVLLFRRKGELIVHRVLRIWRRARGICFLEQGDKTHVFGIVSAGRVVGRVTLVRRGNRILDLVSPPSRITGVALTAWLCLVSSTVRLLKRSRNRAIKKAGRVLSTTGLLFTNLLVRACFAVWCPAGLLVTRHRKAGPMNHNRATIVSEVEN